MTSSANLEAGRVLPAPETEASRFCFWLQTGLSGSVIEYHRGFLVLDAHPIFSLASGMKRDDICLTRHQAYEAARKKLVYLVQRRLAPDTFSYLAVRRYQSDRDGTPAAQLAVAVAT